MRRACGVFPVRPNSAFSAFRCCTQIRLKGTCLQSRSRQRVSPRRPARSPLRPQPLPPPLRFRRKVWMQMLAPRPSPLSLPNRMFQTNPPVQTRPPCAFPPLSFLTLPPTRRPPRRCCSRRQRARTTSRKQRSICCSWRRPFHN